MVIKGEIVNFLITKKGNKIALILVDFEDGTKDIYKVMVKKSYKVGDYVEIKIKLPSQNLYFEV